MPFRALPFDARAESGLSLAIATMPFGQLVVGPPGSGKTTYCRGMQQFLQASGRRTAIVNLDPANDALPYEAAVDIADLVCLEEVMAELKLGPNGDFSLEFYSEVQDLGYLVEAMGTRPFSSRFKKLSQGLCEVIEEYGLVSFTPLAIQDRDSLAKLVMAVDKANGYCFATLRSHTPYPPELLYGSQAYGGVADRDVWLGLQERYADGEVTERPQAGGPAVGEAEAAVREAEERDEGLGAVPVKERPQESQEEVVEAEGGATDLSRASRKNGSAIHFVHQGEFATPHMCGGP
ncbi:GPN-loop GTPase 2 [Tetrabaena socialis]|uniref:GPN-loop GTPase 2 n=1 Tax=Tetrabaena socialis TaxID=47790 RepID=A0A2J8A431_9CHLO|nr:GPN-loop GTPase 2 [Tetrabaena socialis]|eukprot:PNH07274.1 GPN-loop GTPase 2 [Tetrabaena socialis]